MYFPSRRPASRNIHSPPLFRSTSHTDLSMNSSSGTLQMGGQDPFDFTPSHPGPLSSSLHSNSPESMSPPSSPPPYHADDDGVDASYGHLSSLSQDFCTNFSCCGLLLADMHELLDHFEESHVVVVGQDGRPIYPCISNSNSELDVNAGKPLLGQYASLVLSYPSVKSPDYAGEAALAELDALHLDTSSLSSGSTSSTSSPIEPMCLPPSLLTIKPSSRRGHTSLDYALLHGGHLSPPTSNDTLACRDRKASVRRIKAKLFGGSGRADRRHANSKRREREKMHKCPRSGCSKSYLNPNGLKYHLEKGTCTVMGAVV